MGAVAEFVEDVTDTVGDIIESVGDAVVDVLEFAVDKVIDPVAETVGRVVQSAIDDPLKTIAQVAAVATGNAWALPLIEGADVAVSGGDLSDVLEATAKAYVMQEAASYVGKAAGTYAGETAAAAGADVATQKLAETIVKGAAGSATVAAVAGRDPIQALLTGGVSAGAGALLGKVQGFDTLPKAAQNAIGAAVMTTLSGGNVNQQVISSLIASSGLTTDIIKQIDPNNSMTDPQRAVVTDILMGTASAALTGGNASNVIRAAMLKNGSKALGDMITGQFKTSVNDVTKASQDASAKASQIESNEAAQKQAISQYNSYQSQLQARINEQNRLIQVAENARIALENDKTNQSKYDAALAAKNAAEAYISQLNTDYANTFRPNLDKYGAQIDSLKQTHAVLNGDYEKLVQAFATKTDKLTEVLDPIYYTINRAFVEAMSPDFNASEYAKINGLSASEDPYEHFLAKGQFESAPVNLKAAEAQIGAERTRLVTEALRQSGLSIDTANPEQVKTIIDNLDKKYGNNVAALRAATAQDVLSSNTQSIAKMVDDQKNGVFRVESVGQSFGQWKQPEGYTPPAGLRLASLEEMESGKATYQFTKDGNPVWLAQDSTSDQKYWDPVSGDYTAKPPEIVVTAKRPSTSEVYAAYAEQEADDTFKNLFKTVASVVATGAGEQLTNWSSAFALQFGGDMNNLGVQLGSALADWGKANSPADIKQQMKAVQEGLDAAAKKGTFWEQMSDTAALAKKNPGAFLAYIGQEVTQEGVPTAASFVTGAIATALSANPMAGVAAGTLIATTIEGIETLGSTGREVYNSLIKQGYSEQDARARALLAGYSAAAMTAPANALANAAVMMPYLKGLGTGANILLQGVKGVGANAASEYIETYGQTVVTQYATNKKLDLAQANVQATFSSLIGGGTGGVILSPVLIDGTVQVGKDIYGGKLTWEGLTSGRQLADFSTVNGDIILGKDDQDKPVTVASAFYGGQNSDGGKALTSVIPEPPALTQWFDPYYYDAEEAKAAAAQEGYTLNEEEALALIGVKNQAVQEAATRAQFDPLATTKEEATKFLADAYKSFGFDVKPTDQQVQSFVGQVSEQAQLNNILSYANQETVTFDEAKSFLEGLGYKPTNDEINSFVAATNQAQQESAITSYVDPRMVDEAEARAAYEALGLKKPTMADVQKLMGQYAETDLTGKATENLDSARYNSIIAQLDDLAANQGIDPAVLETIKSDLNRQIEALGGDIDALKSGIDQQLGGISADIQAKYDALTTEQKALADQLRQQGVDFNTAIQQAQQQTQQQIGQISADVQAKYDALTAEQKALADTLRQQGVDLNTAIQTAQQQTQEQIGQVSADVQAKYDALTAEQKALADALRQQGVDLNTAINTATAQISADVQAKYDSLSTEQKALADALRQQGVDLNTAIETVRAQTQEQIGGLSADLQTKYNALTAEQKALADQLRQQGIDTAAAIEQARTAISADVQAKYDALSAGQKTLADQLAQQGVDLRSAIDIAAQQTQQQVMDLGTSLNQRVDQLMQQGLDQYTATQQAIAEVNQQNQQLQGLVGTQGRTATQADVDALTQMLSGQRQADLTYDVNRDNQITQDDLAFLQSVVAGTNVGWKPQPGTIWGGTGLYGQLAANEAQRLADLQAAEAKRQQDLAAQQEANRQAAIRSTAGQAGAQVQQLMGQLPQALQAMQTTSTPIYGEGIGEFDLSSPLDVGFFKPSKEKQGSQTGQQATKIATGGYLDDLLDLLR